MKEYYKAYEDRYKKVHKETGLAWAGERPSPILKKLLKKHHANKDSSILEIGCGEGQNAIYLMSNGFNFEASDVSKEAIKWCKKQAKEMKLDGKKFFVLDALDNNLKKKYDFIYSVAVLHMLVGDEERNKFLTFVRDHLNEKGKAFIIVMGNGIVTRNTGTEEAFELAEKAFGDSTIQVAATSCRIVTWEEYLAELDRAGLNVIDHYIDDTVSGFEQSKVMVAEVEIKKN